jgi:protein-tyrosine phosphatase
MTLQDAVDYITEFGLGLFSDKQAAQIVGFVEGIKDTVKGILVHCEAGVSRSRPRT